MSARGKKGVEARAPRSDPREELAQRLSGGGGETWGRSALVVLALFAGLVFYLGLRPGGRGPIWVYVYGRFWISALALVVFSWGLVQSLRRRPFLRPARMRAFLALTLVIGVANYPFPYPSSHEGHPSRVAFRLPVEGEWTVYWGGEELAHNRLAAFYPDRRFGLDLVVTEEGRSYRGDGRAAEDHLAFEREVLAPADGRVVRVHAGEADDPPGRPTSVEPLGNHLVIEVAPGEFLFLSHLRAGSIRVGEGEQVAVGQMLARVGSSGFSPVTPLPHLGLHLQDTPEPRWGEAIPWRFHDYIADGEAVERGLPRGGVGADGRAMGQRIRSSAGNGSPGRR